MRAVVGLLLLLLGLCGSGAQGEAGDLGEVAEINQNTEQTSPDIWTELRDMVVELKVQVELLQRENSDLQTRLSSSESRTDQLETENADLQTRLSSSESRTDQLETENAEKPKVAFYTALTDTGPLGHYDTDITLKFSKVFTNIGNAYNPSTGFFIAPVKGVYNLQFTVMGYNSGRLGVDVYKNNQRIMHNWEENDSYVPEYLTNSLVLELTAGDEIYLVLPLGHSIFDSSNNFCTFSGSLLFTL